MPHFSRTFNCKPNCPRLTNKWRNFKLNWFNSEYLINNYLKVRSSYLGGLFSGEGGEGTTSEYAGGGELDLANMDHPAVREMPPFRRGDGRVRVHCALAVSFEPVSFHKDQENCIDNQNLQCGEIQDSSEWFLPQKWPVLLWWARGRRPAWRGWRGLCAGRSRRRWWWRRGPAPAPGCGWRSRPPTTACGTASTSCGAITPEIHEYANCPHQQPLVWCEYFEIWTSICSRLLIKSENN